ncbi:Methyltransferase type 11 [Thioalkalivibrio sulfidiphilus HL-EbGr7]|uniref:Methyltransferase type 11 n=1 Tax=Thioalkalivibrio sulfidiphilus (strain HL-EbGR7) TaxID=396588 RepID=B8GS93_THISH|nr:MerC family mercury resistance protein [Thioalkalivibrio sulfidiphilus]ACL72797.1 Methyltransferase type 11 [Thioalkalivibrio sulfidiphilus HL-EbGr7]
MVAILGYSREQIFAAVKDMYTAVADSPDAHFHFPVGGEACRTLGYPPEQIAALPEAVRQSFAGVGYPFNAQAVRAGDTVLDIGAGAGNDTVIASRIAGSEGHVIALDLTPAMTRKLKAACDQTAVANVSVLQGSAERLPLADGSVDSITSNGALNLVPDKRRAIGEMFRVLRPGGRVQLADVVIRRPVTVDCHEDPRLWVECVVGATVDEDLLTMFRDAGFEDVEVVRELDYFAHSPSAQTREVAASFDARSMELGMSRGDRAPSRLMQWLKRLNPVRWVKSLWRRGFFGLVSLAAAVIVCYGTLAALALLGVLGFGFALDEGLWAGAIALFAVLAAAAITAGARRHRSPGPPILAATGAGVILYALFVDYSLIVELIGFILLSVSALRDLQLRRRVQARVLGLQHAVGMK